MPFRVFNISIISHNLLLRNFFLILSSSILSVCFLPTLFTLTSYPFFIVSKSIISRRWDIFNISTNSSSVFEHSLIISPSNSSDFSKVSENLKNISFY